MKKNIFAHSKKIAIFSDTHDNWLNIKKAIKYLNKYKIQMMIHCGDVCAPATLTEIIKLYKGEIHLVKGNADSDIEEFKNQAQKHKNIIFYGHTGKLEINNLKIVWTHEPYLAKKMAQSQQYDFIFYGHTHTPWQEKNNKTNLINPGTLAGLFTKATFAIFDTQNKKAQLIILEKI